MPKTRLTPKEVEEIRQKFVGNMERTERESAIARLCDSHEVYRGFAQRFIDIYSGRVANEELAKEAAKKNVHPQDVQTVALFALFLEIVGPIAPKV